MRQKAIVEFSGSSYPVSTWIPSGAINRLDCEAQRLDINRSILMKQIILDFLKKPKKSKPPVAKGAS